MYHSGVYDEENCGKEMQDLDHGVLVVGYGKLLGCIYMENGRGFRDRPADGRLLDREEQLERHLGQQGLHPHVPQQGQPVRHRHRCVVPAGLNENASRGNVSPK
jgi:Papain family cysteine protease